MISARKALKIARDAHEGQLRKHGGDYIWHSVAVATNPLVIAAGEEVMACALMHDVIEDSEVTLQQLIEHGLNHNQQRIMTAVTHNPGEPNVEYMARIKQYGGAMVVKLADSLHNYDELAVLLTLEGDNSNGETWRQTYDRLNKKYRKNITDLEEWIGVPDEKRTIFAAVNLGDFIK